MKISNFTLARIWVLVVVITVMSIPPSCDPIRKTTTSNQPPTFTTTPVGKDSVRITWKFNDNFSYHEITYSPDSMYNGHQRFWSAGELPKEGTKTFHLQPTGYFWLISVSKDEKNIIYSKITH
jgi:hypothetical protein